MKKLVEILSLELLMFYLSLGHRTGQSNHPGWKFTYVVHQNGVPTTVLRMVDCTVPPYREAFTTLMVPLRKQSQLSSLDLSYNKVMHAYPNGWAICILVLAL